MDRHTKVLPTPLYCHSISAALFWSAAWEILPVEHCACLKRIGNVHGTILGCIINKVSKAKGYGYHSYYKYYSYYNYKYAENKKMRLKRHLPIGRG